MSDKKLPIDADVVANILIGRAVTISKLLHLHNEQWPDYPELPIRPVALVESGLSELSNDAKSEFFSILPRYLFLQNTIGSDEMPPARLAFETEQLVMISLSAWSLAPMETTWPAVKEILSQINSSDLQDDRF